MVQCSPDIIFQHYPFTELLLNLIVHALQLKAEILSGLHNKCLCRL